MKRAIFAIVIVFASLSAFPQGFRWDIPPILNQNGLPVHNPQISLCTGLSAINGSTCPTAAQSFTDITLNTPCPIGFPVTLPTNSVCQATGDALGNAGFWLSPGTYIYCVNAPSTVGKCYNLTVPVGAISSGGAQLSAAKLQNTFWVDGYPTSGCTVNSVVYTTQLDCAYYTAKQFGIANQISPVLHIGNGIYPTCAGLVADAAGTGVSIVGEGTVEMNGALGFTQNNGTVIQASCSLGTSPVISYPVPTHGRENLRFEHFTVDANNNSTGGCWNFYGVSRSRWSDLLCSNVTNGGDHWGEWGSYTGLGIVSEAFIENVKASGKGVFPTSLAAVTANVIGGNIATNGYTVTNAGTGYFHTGTIQAYLIGYGTGNAASTPCTVMPTGLTATVAGVSGSGTVSSVQSTVGASGCSGTIFVLVPDIEQSAYGFKFTRTPDSSISDVIVRYIGTTAGIYTNSASTTFYHSHIYSSMPIGIQDLGGNNTWDKTECDSYGHYCFDFGGEWTQVFGTIDIPIVQGSSPFHFGTSNTNITINGHTISESIAEPTGYHRFVTDGSGAIDTTRWNNNTSTPNSLFPTNTKIVNLMPSSNHAEYNFTVSDDLCTSHQFCTFTGFTTTAGVRSFFEGNTEIDNGFNIQGFSDAGATKTFQLDSSIGALQGKTLLANQGAICTNGELALSAGWQSTGTATVTAVAGNGQTCSWTITTGTTTAANPTVTDTLTNALPGATTVCEMNIHGGTHTPAAGEGFQQTTLSATAPIFTFNGTPTAGGTTYFVTRRCGP